MKSLHKAFDILELVFNQDGQPITPSAIAEGSGLNGSTCVRILEAMAKRGYVEKVSRRSGYVPGPAVFGMSQRGSPYFRIIKAAEEPLKRLAWEAKAMVNISVMRGGRRYILNYYNASSHRMPVPNEGARYTNHYSTATGRLLLSLLGQEELEEVIESLGVPDREVWPEADSMERLFEELSRIRKSGYVSYDGGRQWVLGGVVRGEGCPPAAVGFGIEKGDVEVTAASLRRAIAQIESSLRQGQDFQ